MTLNDARTVLTKELNKVYDSDELKNIIELVIEHVTNMPRAEQVRNKVPYLTCTQLEDLDAITERLKKNEPVQYVLGEVWFAGMKFKVNKTVLIPRPETEELVDWIVQEINAQYSTFNGQCSIMDIGTGSGCIPIVLKKKLPQATVSAIDVCSEALFTATENAIGLTADVDFILLDFLDEEKWKQLGQHDIIVSNPPYVKQSEINTMHERVKEFEPRLALFVPDEDALIFYKKLADFSLTHLNSEGSLFVEINEALGDAVVKLFQSAGFANIEMRKDMQGKDRMVMASV
ncbi:MAG TPA: peptide chain release factor N(5)-glutamine methyltransferase [Chitinophagaceae bacterium]|nr:peptide chain release factor N(5)-glutamine methyltransferase [Chitinophagaceae bacterium]